VHYAGEAQGGRHGSHIDAMGGELWGVLTWLRRSDVPRSDRATPGERRMMGTDRPITNAVVDVGPVQDAPAGCAEGKGGAQV
jgi:hypothetical protein